MCDCQKCKQGAPEAAPRVDPSTVFTINVTNNQESKATFEAPEDIKLEFVLADVAHEHGHTACGLGWRLLGRQGQQFWSPEKDGASVEYPLIAHLVPASLHDAHRYPSPFREWEMKQGERYEFIVQHRNGVKPSAEPYTVKLTFFARRACGGAR